MLNKESESESDTSFFPKRLSKYKLLNLADTLLKVRERESDVVIRTDMFSLNHVSFSLSYVSNAGCWWGLEPGGGGYKFQSLTHTYSIPRKAQSCKHAVSHKYRYTKVQGARHLVTSNMHTHKCCMISLYVAGFVNTMLRSVPAMIHFILLSDWFVASG